MPSVDRSLNFFATCQDADCKENVSVFMAQNHIMSSLTRSVLAITLVIIVFLVLSYYESSTREKQWAVHKQFLLPVKTSPALMHNIISPLKHDLLNALNFLLCAPDKQCGFISSLIIMVVRDAK